MLVNKSPRLNLTMWRVSFQELKGEITVEEVDITVDTTRAAEYGIMSVPAIVINGVLKFMGVPKKEELKKALEEEFEMDE